MSTYDGEKSGEKVVDKPQQAEKNTTFLFKVLGVTALFIVPIGIMFIAGGKVAFDTSGRLGQSASTSNATDPVDSARQPSQLVVTGPPPESPLWSHSGQAATSVEEPAKVGTDAQKAAENEA